MQLQIINYLNDEFRRRKARNPQYSKRAYARDMGISKSALHDTLSGKKKISRRSLEKVARFLDLPNLTITQILESEKAGKIKNIEESEFSQICHWYYFAILSLAEIRNVKSDYQWISKRLGIDETTTKEALEHLKRLKMIDFKSGTLIRTTESISASWGVPSRSLKIFHSENLSRADNALFRVSMQNREISSITAAISKDQFEKIKIEAKKFSKKILKITEEKSDPTEVYTIALQIFPQTNGGFYGEESKNVSAYAGHES